MVEFYTNLHPVVQGLLKGLAVILVIFPIGGICSMAERKVSAWIQGRPGPNRAIVPWAAWIPFLGPFLQRLGHHHHAGPAPVGPVVDPAVIVRREIARIPRLQLAQPFLERPARDAVAGDRLEHLREDRDHVEVLHAS